MENRVIRSVNAQAQQLADTLIAQEVANARGASA
jgi:hypothetical protein